MNAQNAVEALVPRTELTESVFYGRETVKRPDRKTLLLAGANDIERRHLADVLRDRGYRVIEAADGLELVDYLAHAFIRSDALAKPDAVISDVALSGWTGFQVCQKLRMLKVFVPFLLLSSTWNEETWEQGQRAGASYLFEKPLDWTKLIETLNALTSKSFEV